MATEYKEISSRLPEQYTKSGSVINALVEALEKNGQLPSTIGRPIEFLSLPSRTLKRMLDEIMQELDSRKEVVKTRKIPDKYIVPEILDPEKNWNSQINRLIDHGFDIEVGLSSEEYTKSIPAFQPQPENFKGRFNIPLLVDPRIPLGTQLRLLHVGFPEIKTSNLEEVVTPESPYQIWVQDGTRFMGHSCFSARRTFANDERGLTIIEGLALFREIPKVLEHHPVMLVGAKGTRITVRGPREFTHTMLKRGNNTPGAQINHYPSENKPHSAGAASCGLPVNS